MTGSDDLVNAWDEDDNVIVPKAWMTSEPGETELPAIARLTDLRAPLVGEDYIRDGRGTLIANAHNVAEFLKTEPEFKGIFATDTFANKRVLLKQLPNLPGKRLFADALQLTETHLSAILSRVQRRAMPKATKAMLCDALDLAFADTTIHPVKDYLDALEWDERPRLRTWLQVYLGAHASDACEQDYLSSIGKAWMISAVARIYQPGCKADCALILEGGQGIGKSTTAAILAGDWFGDALPHMGTKDAASYLQGLWIIEMAELANMARAEVEVVKAFMSRTEDRFRPAYARLEVSVPRQCVFIGSTNADGYLRDTTGNRRFWPVRCGSIDTKALKADRDQLWAEAVAAYQAGEKWWLDQREAELATKQQAERVDSDEPLAKPILEAVAGKETEGVCISEIMELIFTEKRERNKMVSNQIARFLRAEGWIQDGYVRLSKGYGKQRRFVKQPGRSSDDMF
jgi:predicted P-loop ATPase